MGATTEQKYILFIPSAALWNMFFKGLDSKATKQQLMLN